MNQLTFDLPTEADTEKLAHHLADNIKQENALSVKIYLSGNLGAGKTTFARFFLQALGVKERIKSPTYTIVEPYCVDENMIFHIDLYRINAHEIHDLGFLEETKALWLIEWPEKGVGVLPKADLYLQFDHTETVLITIMPNTEIGHLLVSNLTKIILL